jgi:NTE family protein
MGADVVIAVDVGSLLKDRSELDSPFALVLQAVDAMMLHNTRESLEQADIVINPKTDEVQSVDYRKWKQIAKLGYDAMQSQASWLKKLSLSEEAWRKHVAERRERRNADGLSPDYITIEGTSPHQQRYISRALDEHIGRPLDVGQLNTDLTALTGTGRIESLVYEAEKEGDTYGLRIMVKEKDHGPPFMNFSIDINNEADTINFNFGTRITAYDFYGENAELRFDVAVGEAIGLGVEYYRPLGESSWFVAPRAFYRRRSNNFFIDDTLVANYRERRAWIGGDLGYTIGRNSEFRLGYDFGRRTFRLRVGDPFLPEAEGKEEVARMRWVYDGQDSATIPSRGLSANSHLLWFLDAPAASDTFRQGEAGVSHFWPFKESNRLFLAAKGGASFDDNVPAPYQFTLGGPFNMGAYDTDEFRGDNFLLATVGYLRTMSRLPDFVGGRIFLGGWLEVGSAFDEIDEAAFHTSFSAGLLMDTALGPFFLGGSVGEDGSTRFYFALGRLVK